MNKTQETKKAITKRFLLYALVPLVIVLLLIIIAGSDKDAVFLLPLSLLAYFFYLMILFIIMAKKVKALPYDQQQIDTLLKGQVEAKPNVGRNIFYCALAQFIILPLSYSVGLLVLEIILPFKLRNSEEFLAAVIIAIAPTVLMFRELQKDDREKMTKKKIQFYKECLEQNIHQVQSSVEVQKARLIADKMGFNKVSDLAAFYAECKGLLGAQEEQKENNELAMKKSEDQRKYEEYTKYAEFTAGREKRITMLADALKVALEERAEAAASMKAASAFGMQKEKGWGFQAGMASALGGTGAAVATAMDIAADNAQIRASNAANAPVRAFLGQAASRSYDEACQKVDNLRKQLDDAQTKLVYETNEADILKHIQFSQIKTTVTEAGGIEIEATAKLRQELTIFDGLAAVVDGAVMAEIYDTSAKVGETMVVLPALGVNHQTECTLKGIHLTGGKQDKQYQVRFKPYHLWEMEA